MATKVAEVEKYADGSEIKRFPRWVYPNNKPQHAKNSNVNEHNGILVNTKEDFDKLVKERPEFGEFTASEEPDKKKWK